MIIQSGVAIAFPTPTGSGYSNTHGDTAPVVAKGFAIWDAASGGNCYLADGGAKKIYKITPAGASSIFASTPSNSPVGVVFVGY